jgi:hypothetical protein
VKEEIGEVFHVIHTNFAESAGKAKIFSKLVTTAHISEPTVILHLINHPPIICYRILKIINETVI